MEQHETVALTIQAFATITPAVNQFNKTAAPKDRLHATVTAHIAGQTGHYFELSISVYQGEGLEYINRPDCGIPFSTQVRKDESFDSGMKKITKLFEQITRADIKQQEK